MLSRRNIRIKVMKALYALNRDEDLTTKGAKRFYQKSLDSSYELYLFNLWQFLKITEYANKDAARRAAKLLPSEEDKNFSTKLYNNPLIQSIATHKGLEATLKERKIRFRVEADKTRAFYQDFAKADAYKVYLKQTDTQRRDHLAVLLALLKQCMKSETYNDLIDDRFVSWEDDKSLVLGAMKKTLKSLPTTTEFYLQYLPDEETAQEYGAELLHKTIHFDKEFVKLIRPALRNWDAERLAIMDMILIKMALCELLYFPTIPPKVTINEYVEVSKLYSTPKSKDFINGILDRLTKFLRREGKLEKTGRGLIG